MLLIVSGTFWVFLKVAVFGLLVAPTARLPNGKLAGIKLLCAKPGVVRTNKNTRAKTAWHGGFVQKVAGFKLGTAKEWVGRFWRMTNSELRIYGLQERVRPVYHQNCGPHLRPLHPPRA